MWFLRQRLQTVVTLQQGMMETRLTREMEKNRSVLAKTRPQGLPVSFEDFPDGGMATSPQSNRKTSGGTWQEPRGAALEEEDNQRRAGDDLTDEQRQMFEQDNRDMLKHYQTTLDKVRCVGISSNSTLVDKANDNLQDGREISPGNLRATGNAGQQSCHAVSTHRSARGGFSQHDGERWGRKQAAEEGDGTVTTGAMDILCGQRIMRNPHHMGSYILVLGYRARVNTSSLDKRDFHHQF